MVKNNLKQETSLSKFLYNQVTFILAIIGVAFGIYFTFANPARLIENRVILLESDISSHKDLQTQLDTIQKNDLHTIQVKLDDVIIVINDLSKEVVKLQTVIQERIPSKK